MSYQSSMAMLMQRVIMLGLIILNMCPGIDSAQKSCAHKGCSYDGNIKPGDTDPGNGKLGVLRGALYTPPRSATAVIIIRFINKMEYLCIPKI